MMAHLRNISCQIGQSVCIALRLGKIGPNLKTRLLPGRLASQQRKMTSWETEKLKCLNLDTKAKCSMSGLDKFVSLSGVDTWKDYYEKEKIADKTQPTEDDKAEFAKNSINSSLNSQLSCKVSIFKGSITQLEVDAIVNAANSALKKGAGVDGAIHKAAGPLLQEECWALGGCPTGEAKITGGYGLPAKYVIHTVGPQNKSVPDLSSCYDRSFAVANENGVKTIAFPCIGTGVYGFPNRLACHTACARTREFLESDRSFERVVFCLFLPVDIEIYETVMQMYFPVV